MSVVFTQETVASDIRASVAYARAEFKPNSLALMGFCYGGGKALEEAAAGDVGVEFDLSSLGVAYANNLSL